MSIFNLYDLLISLTHLNHGNSKVLVTPAPVRTHLHVPLLAHGIYHTPFDGSPTSATDGDTHFIMARQAVQFSLQLPGISSQLLPVHDKDTHRNDTTSQKETGIKVANTF